VTPARGDRVAEDRGDGVADDRNGALRRASARLLSLLPVLPLAACAWAYAWMAHMYGTWDLRGLIVHESGKYTLLQTIFFTNHFCREWPVKLVYILAAAAIFRAGVPVAPLSDADRARARRAGLAALAGAIVLVTGAFLHAVLRSDASTAALDLFQFHSNDTAPASWGAHWRFHFLSGLAFLGGAGFLTTLAGFATGGPSGSSPAAARERRRGLVRALLIFAAATLVFVPSLEPFLDPRFLGHQFREATGTDLPIALPLLMTAFLWSDRFLRRRLTSPAAAVDSRGEDRVPWRRLAGWTLAAAVPVALNAALLLRGAGVSGNRPPGAAGWSIVDLYAAHVYEHSLDYLFYLLAGTAVLLLAASVRGRRD
jgi:hypothetical protein